MDVGVVRDRGSADHAYLAAVLNQMPVGIGIYDRLGTLVHANERFEYAAGGAIPSIAAMAEQGWSAVSHDGSEIQDDHWPGHRALRGQLATVMVDFRKKTDAGIERLLAMSAVPLTAPDDGVTGAVVIVKQPGERRQPPAGRPSERDFHRFADSSCYAFMIANQETGAIEYVSRAAERIWSHREAMITMAEWAESVHPDDRSQAIGHRQLVKQGEAQCFEYRITDAQCRTIRHLRESCFPIPGEAGEADRIGVIVEDVSPPSQVYLVRPGDEACTDLLSELGGETRRITILSYSEDVISTSEFIHPGCVVLDLRGIPITALAITEVLRRRPSDLPVILVDHAETPADLVIAALRAGAQDFILSPFPPGVLASAVCDATRATSQDRPHRNGTRDLVNQRLAGLSRREREVLLGLIAGGTNKSIARTLNISPRTIEAHRAHLMDRLDVSSLAELLQLAHEAGLRPPLDR